MVVVLMELGLLRFWDSRGGGFEGREVGRAWRICVWKGSEEGVFCLRIGIVGRHISSIGHRVIDGDGRVSLVPLITR